MIKCPKCENDVEGNFEFRISAESGYTMDAIKGEGFMISCPLCHVLLGILSASGKHT